MQELYKDDISIYNPITNVVFFLGAIIMGMFFLHPAFVAVSILIGVIYLVFLKKKKALRKVHQKNGRSNLQNASKNLIWMRFAGNGYKKTAV